MLTLSSLIPIFSSLLGHFISCLIKNIDRYKLVKALVLWFLTGFFKPFTFISQTFCLSQSSLWCVFYLLFPIIYSLINVSDWLLFVLCIVFIPCFCFNCSDVVLLFLLLSSLLKCLTHTFKLTLHLWKAHILSTEVWIQSVLITS